MDSKSIDELELAFNIELPDVYRDFLLSYPEQLLQTSASEWELVADAERLAQLNKLVDQMDVEGWPDSFFAIGESGCGDYYGINLDEEDGEVYFWFHETDSIEPESGFPTLDEFAGHLLLPIEERVNAKLAASRKWWEFWKK